MVFNFNIFNFGSKVARARREILWKEAESRLTSLGKINLASLFSDCTEPFFRDPDARDRMSETRSLL